MGLALRRAAPKLPLTIVPLGSMTDPRKEIYTFPVSAQRRINLSATD
jgi:hypothetical protein